MTERSPAEQLRRSIDLLWGEWVRPTRGPKPSLNLERIVDAAIALADREGIDALSMRRVAAELGAGTMSLYRHVPGKAELLALMLDKVSELGDDAARIEHAGWREVVEMAARGSYQLYLRHPWLIQVNWTRPVLGPNTLASVEVFVRGLRGLAITDQERISIMIMVDGYVTGIARQRIQNAAVGEETGLTDEEFWNYQYPVLAKAMESGDYPYMAAMSEDAFGLGWDETFEFGLQRLLDGIASLLDSRARSVATESGS
ncbi:TetR/AcrR family transcriptional regulator [Micromonospora sp. CPCC 206061]|uniref:TetR/AcrR family transcriptional regulator n=1 Tax=Micromonospora sp. CPCC 206061 TaxID=3122410 RepID=UPI002FF1835A